MSEIVIPSPQRIRVQQNLIIKSFGLAGVVTEAALLGSVSAAYAARTQQQNQNPVFGKVGAVIQDSPLPGKTPLGTPVWSNLVITADSYTDPVTQKQITIPNYTFYSVLITLDFEKIIIETDIQGRDGTIKEYIATKDAIINIKGGVFGTNNNRNAITNDLIALKQIFKQANISIKAQAPIFDEWDITNFVTKHISIPESMGGHSYQLFEANCVSDQDVILNLAGL